MQALLFHVTHRRNIGLIRRLGLRTSRDRRHKGRIWLADRKRIGWAVNHVCQSHRWEPWEVGIIGVHGVQPRACGRVGIGYVTADIDRASLCLF